MLKVKTRLKPSLSHQLSSQPSKGNIFSVSGEDINFPPRKEAVSALRKARKRSGRKILMFGYIAKLKDKVKRLRQRLGHGNIENLKPKQLRLLNDLSYFPKYETVSIQSKIPLEVAGKKSHFSRVLIQ
jgi:hypothetical protein